MQISDVVPEVSQTSANVHEVASVVMSISFHRMFKVLQAKTTWRVLGLLSYALGPSFNRLFGRWNPFKVFLYVVLSLAILTTILFAKQSSISTFHTICSTQNLHTLCSFDDHLSVFILLRQSFEWKTRHTECSFKRCIFYGVLKLAQTH